MRILRRTILTAATVLVVGAWADTVDPRVRVYVDPVRVLWQTPKKADCGERSTVADAETLLEKRRGRVPEGGWGEGRRVKAY